MCKSQDKTFEAWIDARCKDATAKTRALIFQMAQIKFSVVVGKVWPTEFKSVNENMLTVTVDGISLDGTLNAREVQVKI